MFEEFCSLQMLSFTPLLVILYLFFITQSRFLGDAISILCFLLLFFTDTKVMQTILQIHGFFSSFKEKLHGPGSESLELYSNSYYWPSMLTGYISRSRALKTGDTNIYMFTHTLISMLLIHFSSLLECLDIKGIKSNNFNCYSLSICGNISGVISFIVLPREKPLELNYFAID